MVADRELDAPQINALVAEHVMGWADCNVRRLNGLDRACGTPPNGNYPTMCPDAFADISAAWEVVEKLRDRHGVEIVGGPEDEGMDDWVVIIKEYGYRPFQDMKWEARADTAPLAICLAALAAVGALPPTTEGTP